MPEPKFTRTAKAAQSDRLSKWDLITSLGATRNVWPVGAGRPVVGCVPGASDQ